MVNLCHISIFHRVLNNIYILFLIVVFILIGKLLYLTLYQIVRYIYIAILFYIVHNILQRIFFINISLYATHVFVYILKIQKFSVTLLFFSAIVFLTTYFLNNKCN